MDDFAILPKEFGRAWYQKIAESKSVRRSLSSNSDASPGKPDAKKTNARSARAQPPSPPPTSFQRQGGDEQRSSTPRTTDEAFRQVELACTQSSETEAVDADAVGAAPAPQRPPEPLEPEPLEPALEPPAVAEPDVAALVAAASVAAPAAPALYVSACGGDVDEARRRWAATWAWRSQHGVDGALLRPQPAFTAVKHMYPHHLHGRTRAGAVVMYERLGRIDLSDLRSGALQVDAVLAHFVFVQEFVSGRYEGEETRLVSVLDAAGLSWSVIGASLFQLVAAASEVVDNLVPFRVEQIMVINGPFWAGSVFRTLKAVLPANVRDRVNIVGADFQGTLAALCEEDQIPQEYGGTSPEALGQADDELRMLKLATALTAGRPADADLTLHASAPADADDAAPALVNAADDVFYDARCADFPGSWAMYDVAGDPGDDGAGGDDAFYEAREELDLLTSLYDSVLEQLGNYYY
ncbi:CRAL-TRIO domain-containing protein [Pelagophyceae sp. CCMP2097]|nr:CRAL-TRIO domain-containing protein [Pelagophyceae sp. CCMP2097]